MQAARSELQAKDLELQIKDLELQTTQEQVAALQAQVANLQRSLFGRKSEATPPGGDSAPGSGTPAPAPPDEKPPDEKPPDEEPPAGKPPRRKRGRQPGSPTPPRVKHPHLPTVVERLDVPEADRCCQHCGTPYQPCGYKVSWLFEIDWEAVRRKLLRLRYRPACACSAARPVIASPAPRLGTSQLGASVWAWCLVQVYALFRPQAAVARDLGHLGLRVPLSTLSAGLRRLSHLFEPLEEAIAAYQRQQPVAQADETSWPVQRLAASDADNKDPPAGGRQKPKSWLWLCLAGGTVRMRVLESRGLDAALKLLETLVANGSPVVLVCDCYVTYKALAKRFPGLVLLAHCWVHIRRLVVRVGTGHAPLKAWSQAWVARIGELFHLNRQRLRQWDPRQPLERQSAAFRALQHQLEARLKALFQLAEEEVLAFAAEWERLDAAGGHGAELARLDAQGRALRSLLHHRESLSRFVADPRIPLDNNSSERALRGPVIARWTSFGSGGPDGARAAGLLFGVLLTVLWAGLNPYAWMLDWLQACARHGGQAPPQLDPWLPWRMSAQRRAQLSQAPAGGWGPSAAGSGAAALGKAA